MPGGRRQNAPPPPRALQKAPHTSPLHVSMSCATTNTPLRKRHTQWMVALTEVRNRTYVPFEFEGGLSPSSCTLQYGIVRSVERQRGVRTIAWTGVGADVPRESTETLSCTISTLPLIITRKREPPTPIPKQRQRAGNARTATGARSYLPCKAYRATDHAVRCSLYKSRRLNRLLHISYYCRGCAANEPKGGGRPVRIGWRRRQQWTYDSIHSSAVSRQPAEIRPHTVHWTGDHSRAVVAGRS